MTYALTYDYDSEVPALRRIMERSAKTQWDVNDIRWETELSDEAYIRILQWQGATRSSYVRGLPKKKMSQLARQFVAFDFSQILHGEQAAMMLSAQLVNCVEDIDAKMYAAIQSKDEARHVEAAKRLVKRIGPIYDCAQQLKFCIDQLVACQLWPKQVLGLQLFLEARALISFRQHMLFVDDPVFKETVGSMELDESQHVAFGMQYLTRGVDGLDAEGREQMVQYGTWLDENIWRLVRSAEYKAVFDECDLDFDEFERTYSHTNFLAPSLAMSSASSKSMDMMYAQFERWFYSALQRVGLTEVLERRVGRKLTDYELAELKRTDYSALPWMQSDMMATDQDGERPTVKKLVEARGPIARRKKAEAEAEAAEGPKKKAKRKKA
ncbi:MAG: ferritin-like domain-containing protein [Myxococcota bacterium]